MAKYKVNWNTIEPNEAPTLIDAVARYVSGAEYPAIIDILNILGVKKENEEENCNG